MTRTKTKVDELRDALKKKHDADEMIKNVESKTSQSDSVRSCEAQVDDLSSQIKAAEEEAHAHYDKLLRVMAEFENFKRRVSREGEEQLKYANEKLLTEMLAPLDDLDRVHDHVPPDAAPELKQLAEGIEMAQKSLMAVLGRFGLKEVPALGEQFDPAKHEAIAVVESDVQGPNTVIAIHRKGYWLFDRLLRPAMVTVAKA